MKVKQPATIGLLLINVIVFAWMFHFSYYFGTTETYYIEKYAFNYTAFSGGEIPKISLLYANFIHGNFLHLLDNLLLLFLFGIFLEREVEQRKILIIYFISGIVGTYLQGYFIPTRVLGASASIYGLIGLFLVVFVFKSRRFLKTFQQIAGELARGISSFSWDAITKLSKIDILLLYPHFLFVVTLLLAVAYVIRIYTNPDPGIGDIAHYWGFAIGVNLGVIMETKTIQKNFESKKWVQRHIDSIVWAGILAVLFIFLLVIIVIERGLILNGLGQNLFAEIIGVILTIILLNLLLSWKDKYKWNLVRQTVYEMLRRELMLVYTDISMFLEGFSSSFGSGTTEGEVTESMRKNYYDKLKSRAETSDLKFNDHAVNMGKANFDEIFEHRKRIFDTFELKYSKFLEPELIHSIVKIEDNLYGASLTFGLFKKDKMREEIFLSNLNHYFKRILEEIYKLYSEYDIEIYYPIMPALIKEIKDE